uniref:Uncharacterized protein n=1 Tax=Octopus bimaculoides TaxID=37653 RepID=A0A0L8HZB4_OCTBM
MSSPSLSIHRNRNIRNNLHDSRYQCSPVMDKFLKTNNQKQQNLVFFSGTNLLKFISFWTFYTGEGTNRKYAFNSL